MRILYIKSPDTFLERDIESWLANHALTTINVFDDNLVQEVQNHQLVLLEIEEGRFPQNTILKILTHTNTLICIGSYTYYSSCIKNGAIGFIPAPSIDQQLLHAYIANISAAAGIASNDTISVDLKNKTVTVVNVSTLSAPPKALPVLFHCVLNTGVCISKERVLQIGWPNAVHVSNESYGVLIYRLNHLIKGSGYKLVSKVRKGCALLPNKKW